MDSQNNFLTKFFGVAIQGQTYRNLLYVLLSFPLGLFYFVFLVVGLSLGVGLAILLVGIFILLAVLLCWWAFAAFERQMTISLLREKIPPMVRPETRGRPLLDQFVALLGNAVTWKSLVYLLVKFPLGIVCFSVSVTMIALTAAFLTAPLTYRFLPLEVWVTWNNVWRLDTIGAAIGGFFVGVLLFFVTLHVTNFLAWVSAKFAKVMLGSPAFAAVPAATMTAPVPVGAAAYPVPAAPAYVPPAPPALAKSESSSPAAEVPPDVEI